MNDIKNRMGEMPKIKTSQAIKPKTGDIRDLVLPGGGCLPLNIWAGMRVKAFRVKQLADKGAQNSSHCATAIAELENFADGITDHATIAQTTLSHKDLLSIKCEMFF